MVQEATRKETVRIGVGTAIGACVMFVVFFVLHMAMPEKVPWDYRVFTGGIAGSAVAVLNFFLMGITVQQVASETDEKRAYQRMKLSYTQRMLLQVIWMVIALVAPVFNGAAGVIPLLFPGITIKIYYIFIAKGKGGAPVTETAADRKESPASAEERGDENR